MKLFEIIKNKAELSKQREQVIKTYKESIENIDSQLKQLSSLEEMATSANLDIEKIQIATSIIYVRGNPYGEADRNYYKLSIAEYAMIDIANDCPHLKTQYYGNKTYGSYYQRDDHEYGYGPKHGSTQDEIGLIGRGSKIPNDEEKDACIYYLKNYKAIQECNKKKAA